MHGAKDRRPVLGFCGKDLRDRMPAQLRDEDVQRRRRIAHLISQASLVQIARFPGLAEQAVRVGSEERKWLYIQQLASVRSGQTWMRHAEVSRQALPADLLRI